MSIVVQNKICLSYTVTKISKINTVDQTLEIKRLQKKLIEVNITDADVDDLAEVFYTDLFDLIHNYKIKR